MIDVKRVKEIKICSVCGKKFILEYPVSNKASMIQKKQKALSMCDTCYVSYLKTLEG